MPGAPDIVGIGTTIIFDHMNGGTDFIKNIDAGIKAMEEVAPNVQTWEPKPDVYATVVNGQVALGVGWNARSQVYADGSKGKMKVVLPKEGTILQINTLNLVKGGPSSAAARKFVDYALSPEAKQPLPPPCIMPPPIPRRRLPQMLLIERLSRRWTRSFR